MTERSTGSRTVQTAPNTACTQASVAFALTILSLTQAEPLRDRHLRGRDDGPILPTTVIA